VVVAGTGADGGKLRVGVSAGLSVVGSATGTPATKTGAMLGLAVVGADVGCDVLNVVRLAQYWYGGAELNAHVPSSKPFSAIHPR